MGILNWFLGKKEKLKENGEIDPVPGASTFLYGDEIIYNMLTPHMQQFMGRCIGAIKKQGIIAKGSGQFSILLGGNGDRELKLNDYYQPHDNPKLVEKVVAEAKRMMP